jgi:hypothetical protein
VRKAVLTSGNAGRDRFVISPRNGLGQHWGNTGERWEGGAALLGGGACGVEGVADLVQSDLEEVPVDVRCHGRRAVPEHLLDDLDVGAGGDREAGRGVPQLVRVQVGHADRPRRRAERRAERAHAQRLAVSDAGEDQVVREGASAGIEVGVPVAVASVPPFAAVR